MSNMEGLFNLEMRVEEHKMRIHQLEEAMDEFCKCEDSARDTSDMETQGTDAQLVDASHVNCQLPLDF